MTNRHKLVHRVSFSEMNLPSAGDEDEPEPSSGANDTESESMVAPPNIPDKFRDKPEGYFLKHPVEDSVSPKPDSVPQPKNK